jgi:isopentenyl-diphosphate delta-isomerase
MSDRKLDHIQLAFEAQTPDKLNVGLYYEPMLSAHPDEHTDIGLTFLGKQLKAPLWVSSMTGGTIKAKNINENLARACQQFGMGMGLGSCRPLLEGSERLSDFAVKELMPDMPLLANLGIAQLEELLADKAVDKVNAMMDALQADGIFIHVNPLQEWMQPEGDKIVRNPIETISQFCETFEYPVMVKEVGQGFGPKSMKSLIKLPIAGIEFGAFGGTNFTKLEHARHNAEESGTNSSLLTFAYIGHTAEEMVHWANQAMEAEGRKMDIIVSGGIKDVLKGYGLIQQLTAPGVIGMASQFLKYAQEDYETLEKYVSAQVDILKMASCFLKRN